MEQPLLIFDLMDTVVLDPFFYLIPNLLGLSMEDLLKLKDPDSWPAFELGEIDEAEYFRSFFRQESGLKIEDPERLKARLFDSYRFVDGMEELLEQLHAAGARLWVHSNYSPWAREIRERLKLDRFFSGYAVSYELKARKPDERAYRAALARIGEEAEKCLLIDDREINVKGAREVDLRGITFKSAPQLRGALSEYGFPI